MPQHVSDFNSNKNDNLVALAQAIGRSAHKFAVFDAVYYHKKRVKSVQEVADRTGLDRMQVLKVGRALASNHLFKQTKKGDDTAYEQIEHVQQHKERIKALAGNKKKQEAVPTKTNPRKGISQSVVRRVARSVGVQRLHIDNISSFKKAHALTPSTNQLPKDLSEEQFRAGIQHILGEPGKFQDWGGENSDLYSGRLVVSAKRMHAAFAFKGPGLNAKLKPKNMGANGDQGPRLFDCPADVFLVQHWREIDPSVIDLIQRLAASRSLRDNRPVWYGVIDGKDSRRIYEAYQDYFP